MTGSNGCWFDSCDKKPTKTWGKKAQLSVCAYHFKFVNDMAQAKHQLFGW